MTPLFVGAVALVGGIIGFVPYVISSGGSGNVGQWSPSEFLGTVPSLAIFCGCALWIGYARPRLWFWGALVTWTTTLQALMNIKNLRPPLDLPKGVTFHPIDVPTILAILLVPIGVAIVGAFVGRTWRLTKRT